MTYNLLKATYPDGRVLYGVLWVEMKVVVCSTFDRDEAVQYIHNQGLLAADC